MRSQQPNPQQEEKFQPNSSLENVVQILGSVLASFFDLPTLREFYVANSMLRKYLLKSYVSRAKCMLGRDEVVMIPEEIWKLIRRARFNHISSYQTIDVLKRLPPNLYSLKLYFGSVLLPSIEVSAPFHYYVWLQKHMLPRSLNKLTLAAFNLAFHHDMFPDSLAYLKIGDHASSPRLETKCLPSSLTALDLSCNFNQDVSGLLPDSLQKLTLGSYFKQVVKPGMLPSLLTFLSLRSDVCLLPGGLPSGLQELRLYRCSNQVLDGVLPASLTSLLLGNWFTQQLVGLPPSLKQLKIGSSFYHSLGTLPSGLVELNLGCPGYDQELVLPPGLTRLKLGGYLKFLVLPDSLRSLEFGKGGWNSSSVLPSGLETLVVGDNYNEPLVLPSSLRSLSLGSGYTRLVSLPGHLENLILPSSYDVHSLTWPSNLKLLSTNKA